MNTSNRIPAGRPTVARNISSRKLFTRLALYLFGLALASSSAVAATIYYVGTLTNSTETVNWLTPATAKTYDVDGDNKYGSYSVTNWVEPNAGTYSGSSISWVNSGAQFRQPEYAKINDVADAAQGNVGPGALINNSPTNTNVGITLDFNTFQVNEDLTGKILRVGVVNDVLGPAEYPNEQFNGVFIRQVAGGGAKSALVPLPAADGRPEMVFFDIVDAQVGDQFEIRDLKNVGGVDSITTLMGPISWDTNATSVVSNAPTILLTSSSDSCMAGDDYSLEAFAGGAPTPSYQWYKDMTPVGGDSAVYTVANANTSDSGNYFVVATTPAGSVTNGPINLTVVSTNLPSSLSSYRAAVMAESSLISYYTFDNGAQDSAGSHSGAFAGTPVAGYQLGQGVGKSLDKAVSLGGDGCVSLGVVPDFSFPSGNGTIEAWVKAAPNWTNGPNYDPCLVSCRDFSGTTYNFNMDGANKSYIGMWNGTTYQTIPIPAAGSTWHHVGIIITNGTWTLIWDGVNMGTLSQPLGSAGSTVPTQIGNSSPSDAQTFENWIGSIDEVSFCSNALSPAEILAHYNAFLAGEPPIITRQPQSESLLAGLSYQMSVAASGDLLSYQWYKDNAPVLTATGNAISFPSLTAADDGNYFCVISNNSGAVTSSPAMLQVFDGVSPAVSNYEAAVKNEPSLISLYTFDNLTANDSFNAHNGTLQNTTSFTPGFSGGPDQTLFLDGSGWVNLGTVPDFDFPSANGTVELWWRADWTANPGYDPCLFSDRDDSQGLVNYSIHVGGDKTYVNFWNGSAGNQIPITPGTNWHHSAVIFNENGWTVTLDGQVLGSGAQYNTGISASCQIGSSGPAGQEIWRGALDEVAYYSTALTTNEVAAHYNAYIGALPPTIITQPQGGNYLAGNTLTLSVTAQGSDLNYQWFKNDAAIGGNSSSLSFPNADSSADGNYYVVITNANDSITSAVAAVSVVQPAINLYQTTVSAESSLISLYTFDSQMANDVVGTNTGTFITTSAFTPGLGGGTNLALSLDGANGAVAFGQVPAFEFPGGQGTIELWLRADWDTGTMTYNPAIVADENATKYYEAYMNAQKTAIILSATATPNYVIPDADTNWHYLTIVMNSPLAAVYWDGQFIGSQYLQIQGASGQTAQLGTIQPYGSDIWQGAMDDCAFYSTALSGPDIAAHYQTMFGQTAEPASLGISLVSGGLAITWPASATGVVLQQTDDLSSGTWTTVTNQATVVDGQNQVIVAPEGSRQFYRLAPQ